MILGLLLAGHGLRGADARTPQEIEAAADAFADVYEGISVSREQEELNTLVEELAKVAGCDEAATKALAEATGPIAEKMSAQRRALFRSYYLEHDGRRQDDTFWDDYPDLITGESYRKGTAEVTAMWENLLHARLTPAQLDLWNEEMKRRRERRAKAGDAFIKSSMGRLAMTTRRNLEARVSSIVLKAELPKERAAMLGGAVEVALKAHMDISRAIGKKALQVGEEHFLSYRTKDLEDLEKGANNLFMGGDNAAWKAANTSFEEAMNKLLPPAELARVKAYRDELQKRMAGVAKDMSASRLEMQRTKLVPERDGRIDRLAATIGMDEGRRKELQTRMETAEKAIGEEWTQSFIATTTPQIKRRTEKGDTEAFLKQMEQGRWGFSDEEADIKAAKERDEAWQAALKALVKTDELVRWEAEEKRNSEQRSHVFALVAVAELDRRLLLLPEQREAIEKLALEAAKPLGSLSMDITELWQGNLGGALLLVHGMGLKNIEALLQEPQKKEFQMLAQRCQYQWARLKPKLRKKT